MKTRYSASIVCSLVALLLAVAVPLWAQQEGKININQAPVEELVQLKYVGPQYARRIVEFREKEPFKTPEDLMKVHGIGARIYEVNKDRIIVE